MCPKCQRTFFKHIDSHTRCCVNCGTVILEPIEVVLKGSLPRCHKKLPNVPYAAKPFDSDMSSRAKAIRCRQYILTVFEFIKNELWRDKTWNQIDHALQPRRDAQCVKTLRKYYREELQRQMFDPSQCVVEGGE